MEENNILPNLEKKIKCKIARLAIVRRRLTSHNINPNDAIFRNRLRQLGRESRYLRLLCQRLKKHRQGRQSHPLIQQYHPLIHLPPPSIQQSPLHIQHPPTHLNVPNNPDQAQNVRFRQPRRLINTTERWSFGCRSETCSHCKALMWIQEKTRDSPIAQPKFTQCCKGGKVMLPFLPPTPQYLKVKLRESRFKEKIRLYNSMLSFTSMGGKIDHSVLDGRGPYVFRISGGNYHRIGSLLPDPGKTPKFAQLYIYDTENEVQNRMNVVRRNESNSNVDPSTLQELQSMLNEINPYVQIFRSARDMLQQNAEQDLRIQILHSRPGRQYIRPTANEVAALIVGDGSEFIGHRDVIVQKLDGTLKRINETHPSYMPLHYPLLFPYGTDGWRRGIEFTHGSNRSRDGVSMREFHAFRLNDRLEEGNTLREGGRLLQQYVVDSYAAIEQDRLNFVRCQQNRLRTELYRGLHDAVVAGDTDASAVGRRCIVPPSFTNGPRNIIQHYQDAMAICRTMGFPDLFITFTCNPSWPEILLELNSVPGQRVEDRPDIVARVFHLKMKQFLKDLKENIIFGKVTADIHVIEFQKRGLPHSHLILTLAIEDKPLQPEDIDKIICAEIPDRENDPLTFETVTRCMIHGPCGAVNPTAPCMVNGKCSKNYPKKFCDQTSVSENSFVIYRRRDTGLTYIINGFEVNNQWVVPYNRDLAVRYDAHINIERCVQTKMIKYLYKYVHKGQDRSTIVIQDNVVQPNQDGGRRSYTEADEVKQYLDCRYVSAIEACWRIFEFKLQKQHPTVERLQFHLPEQQSVLYCDSDDLPSIVNEPGVHETMLTMWFQANKDYPAGNSLTYAEFPSLFVWSQSHKKWFPRKQRICIGRLHYAHPNSGERYYMRMMLTKVRGAKCYEDLRTVSGIQYPTFKLACLALGLLDDDNEWDSALTEASTWASGFQLRSLFCSMLMFSEVTDPCMLWDKHWINLTDDLQNRVRRQVGDFDIVLDEAELRNLGLVEMEQILNQNGRSLKDFPPIPEPLPRSTDFLVNRLIREELNYDSAVEAQSFRTLHVGLNNDQSRAFNTIVEAHRNKDGGLFFVYGSGGTGKTYLWKTLIAKFRSEKKIVLSVASSGIASLLLPGGRTAHSRFKIPLEADGSSCCSISQGSELAKLIEEASLVIWDEAPMASRYSFEAVDRTFRDILKNIPNCSRDRVFGGKLFVLGGDFRQILPVVVRGGREQTVQASLLRSSLWEHSKILILNQNMRLADANLSPNMHNYLRNFAEWIIAVGEGRINGISLGDIHEANWIKIPSEHLIKNGHGALLRLIHSTYPEIRNHFSDISYMNERAILAPKNIDVDEINSLLLSMLPGDLRIFNSSDRLCLTESDNNIDPMNPPEFLHSLKLSGLPNHCLELKVGAPIMLLRNSNQALGLCNGTRLIVTHMGDKVIRATIMTGSRIGEIVPIVRMDLRPSSTHSPFAIQRRQFPIKLAFAMTINKSQGQTLRQVGLYLPHPVFSHGQLYVAFSRVTSPSGLKVLIVNKKSTPEDRTKNVVFREIFCDISNDSIMHD